MIVGILDRMCCYYPFIIYLYNSLDPEKPLGRLMVAETRFTVMRYKHLINELLVRSYYNAKSNPSYVPSSDLVLPLKLPFSRLNNVD